MPTLASNIPQGGVLATLVPRMFNCQFTLHYQHFSLGALRKRTRSTTGLGMSMSYVKKPVLCLMSARGA
jgi:hypothetical protein